MIGAYLQPNGAQWEAQQRNPDGSPVYTETGQRTYAAAVGIPARVKGAIKMVRTSMGEQVPTQAKIITTALVNIGDRVNGREVLVIEQSNTLTGAEAYRTVWI